MPDDLAPRIFEREVTSGKGTGLGLSLARDLASADGARLAVGTEGGEAGVVALPGALFRFPQAARRTAP